MTQVTLDINYTIKNITEFESYLNKHLPQILRNPLVELPTIKLIGNKIPSKLTLNVNLAQTYIDNWNYQKASDMKFTFDYLVKFLIDYNFTHANQAFKLPVTKHELVTIRSILMLQLADKFIFGDVDGD